MCVCVWAQACVCLQMKLLFVCLFAWGCHLIVYKLYAVGWESGQVSVNTKFPALTCPLTSHWLWQVAWRCQETVTSFICESSAQGCAPFHCMSGGFSKGTSLSDVSHYVLLISFFCCCPFNCRIESRMSKSAANQKSPSMVTESSKAVTPAAADTTSGSKVSFSFFQSSWSCPVCLLVLVIFIIRTKHSTSNQIDPKTFFLAY